MSLVRHSSWSVAVLLALLWVPPCRGQSYERTFEKDPFADLLPAGELSRGSDPPQMTFRLLADIPLPGPLPGGDLKLDGNQVLVPVAGGLAVASADPGSTPRIDRLPLVGKQTAEQIWSLDAAEEHRYAALNPGFIQAEKRCKRCRRNWRKLWRLRVSGTTLAAPLVHADRLFFGAKDNRIYCLRRRNGHRIWATEVGHRILVPLVHWSGPAAEDAPAPATDDPGSRRLEAVLAVSADGSELLVFSSIDGHRVARLSFEDTEGWLVGKPLVAPDGRVLVARQKYLETEASLLVYRLELPAKDEPRGDLDYNARASPAEVRSP